MRLEVLVDSEDPLIFPLNKPKIVIGSSETCDIVLNTSGVSRKHMIVQVEGENFYVIDQGSTNGSYINEERLVPGRRVEFTSFFPVRLGDNVLLTLLSDEEAGDQSLSSFTIPVRESQPVKTVGSETTMISLKDLQAKSTETLVKKRQETLVRKKVASKPAPKKNDDKSRMRVVKVVALLMLGAAAYYNFFFIERTSTVTQVEKVEEISPEDLPAPVAAPAPFAKVDSADFLAKNRFIGMLNDLKCTIDLEKSLCDSVAGAGIAPWGVVQIGSSIGIMVDGSSFFTEARSFFKDLPANAPLTPELESKLYFVAHLLFIQKAWPKDFNFEPYKDLKLFVALFNNPTEVGTVAAYAPETLKKLTEVLKPQILESAKRFGVQRLDFLNVYFSHY